MEGTAQSGASTGSEAAEPLDDVRARLGPKLEEAQARLVKANERVKRFIHENPGTCLLGAAALGFLIGRWASRDDE